MNWLLQNTIFLSIHGSQSYGISSASSDLDLKGVCIPPSDVRLDLFHRFDQAENSSHIHDFIKSQHPNIINPNNPKVESVVYSLEKYIKLCASINPTVIELLWMPEQFILINNKSVWNLLKENRNLFLTKKVRATYAGYAKQQLARIQRHKKYIDIETEPKCPERKDFGLNEYSVTKEYGEIDAFIRREIEKWNFSGYGIDSDVCVDLKEDCWDCIRHINMASDIDWANWPETYWKAAFVKLQNQIQLTNEVLNLVMAEKRYNDALKLYRGYEHWKNERNPERRELEKKYGMDTKHASHLVRLYRTGVEALTTGEVQVLRNDAAELKAIRNGEWSYEKLIDFAEEMEVKLKDAEKTSPLPEGLNKIKINELYHELISIYDSKSNLK